MATLKLKLRQDRKTQFDNTTVYVQVCIKSRVKLYSTDIKIKPELWDEKNERVRKTYGYGYEKFFTKINKKKLEIENIIDNAFLQNKEITFEHISFELNKIENAKKIQPEAINTGAKTFYEWYQVFIDENKNLKTADTNKHYKTALNHLKRYFGKKIPTFKDINFEFYNQYVNYLLESVELANSSVNKQLDFLCAFLKHASKLKLFDENIIKDFKPLKEFETHKVYITKEELKMMWEYKFENEKLERVRDLFVFACTTGLRESDFSNIKPENIKNDAIHLTTIKTSDPLVIPLNSYSRAVLKKYNNQLPRYSQQKFNEYIKEVGKEVGIDSSEQVIVFKKNIRTESTCPKYELLSSHTGRRTFITQCILRGISAPVIRTMSGHKDLRSFQRYVKITDTDKQKEMLKWED